MPEQVAEEVVKRDVKLIFDPDTKELIQVVMPFMTKTEVMTLTVDKGWVTEASVEDVKLLPGVHRTMFRLQGGDWVAREIVKDVQCRPRQVRGQQRRRRVVGQSGSHRRRQPVLEARQRDDAEAAAARRTTRCAPPGSRVAGSSASAITRCGATPRSKARSTPCPT